MCTNFHAIITKYASLRQLNNTCKPSGRHLEFHRHFELFSVGLYQDLLSVKNALCVPIFMLLSQKHAVLRQFNCIFRPSGRHLEFRRHFELFSMGLYQDLFSVKSALYVPIFMLLSQKHTVLRQFNCIFRPSGRHLEFCHHFELF